MTNELRCRNCLRFASETPEGVDHNGMCFNDKSCRRESMTRRRTDGYGWREKLATEKKESSK